MITKRPSLREFIALSEHNREQAGRILDEHPDILVEKTSTGETALHYLVVENVLEGVQFLLERGAEVEARDGEGLNDGKTPLMHAVELMPPLTRSVRR